VWHQPAPNLIIAPDSEVTSHATTLHSLHCCISDHADIGMDRGDLHRKRFFHADAVKARSVVFAVRKGR
jgi:hypothetical protein